MTGPRPPELLAADHDIADFDCGRPVLDDWLRRRALANQSAGASRTYVVCEGRRVVGYYSLATGSVAHAESPGRIRRNMPDPIPVMVLRRLAMDRRAQGRGLGLALLQDAIMRTLTAAQIAGIRALLVHALDADAARFYSRRGFLDSTMDPLTLMLPLAAARKALEPPGGDD